MKTQDTQHEVVADTIIKYGTVTGPTVCAWCQQEQGVAPVKGQSHGICEVHLASFMAEFCGGAA